MYICLLSNEFLLTVKYAPSPPNHPQQTAIDHTKEMLALAKTITTIQIKLPLNKEVYTQTTLMARHQKIAKLFDEDFQTVRLKRAKSFCPFMAYWVISTVQFEEFWVTQ